jgi:predicted ATPase
MLVTNIRLKNWRNFKLVDVRIGRRMFLVGPNASGKSNFLDALRFLRDIAKPGGGLQKSVDERGGISKIRCLAARKEPIIELDIALSSNSSSDANQWEYILGIGQEPRGRRKPIVKYEKVLKGSNLILDRPDSDDNKDEKRLTQTHLEQINTNQEFRAVAEYLENIYYLHLIPQLLRHPEYARKGARDEDPFGLAFLEKVAECSEKKRKSRFGKIEEALKWAVPQLEQLSYIMDDFGVPHIEAVYNHWRPHAGKQNESQFSDGTLRLIGFLWALLDGDSLLLLEEPELSLHSGIVKKLPELVWRLQEKKNRQVLISTHSIDLLSSRGIGGEEVLLLKPSNEGTEVFVASSKLEVKSMLEQGFNIGEIAIAKTEPENLPQLDFFSE